MIPMPDRFTDKQGQYLAFIYNYVVMHGRAPAEADLQRFFRTTPPTIHQMILKLADKHGITAPYNKTVYELCKKRFTGNFEPMTVKEVLKEVMI